MKYLNPAKRLFLTLAPGSRWLLVCMILFCLFIAGYEGTAHASSTKSNCSLAANCSLQFFFDGDDRYAPGWGASAIIGDYQVPGVCIGSSAWTMIDNHAAVYGWAQTGYLRLASWSTTTTYYFTETADANATHPPVEHGAMTKGWGSSDTFVTYYDSSVHYIKMLINGKLQAGYAPNWNADEQEWRSETHSTTDYFPGGYNHHTIFANNQYLYNGAWHTINALTYEDVTGLYGDYSGSGSTFYVWDTRIA